MENHANNAPGQGLDGQLFGGVASVHGRFSYLAYVPRPQAGGPSPGLIVTVHGSDYAHEQMCRFFAGLGRETNSVVLAPLFGPASAPRADPDGYKGLRSGHADYDRVLMEMVDEVGTRFGASTERFCLFGFSGGAQFAHRFLYVYPQRLRAVSIAAPGMVTLIHSSQHLWVGTQNLQQEFGRELSLEQIRRVKTQLLVGSTDDAPHFGAAGEVAYNFAGRNRVERLESLAHNYRANGISCETHIVAGAGHDFVPLAEAAVPFLRREMQGAR